MPYKIRTRVTIVEGGSAVYPLAENYMTIAREYITSGAMVALDKNWTSDTVYEETVLWRSVAERAAYGDRVIALLGGNPRTDPDAAALLTPNTIEVLEEGEITEEEWNSRT